MLKLILPLLLAMGLSLGALCALADNISPKDTYLKYRKSMLAASKIDDLKDYLCKEVNEDINNTPADMKPMMFDLMKSLAPATVEIVSEDVKGDNATLLLKGKGEQGNAAATDKSTGKVTLLREGGVWKIHKESWESKHDLSGSGESKKESK